MLDPLLQLRHPALLKFEVRDDALESGLRRQGEVGRRVAEVLIEAGGEGAKHELVSHLGADVAELIGEALEAHAVVINGGVILVAPKKFLLQKHKTLKLVIGEEIVDLGPHDTRVVILRDDRVEDVRRDGEIEPRMREDSMAAQSGSPAMRSPSTLPSPCSSW